MFSHLNQIFSKNHILARLMEVITRVQLLGVTAPLKLGRAKNVQNLVRFTTTFEFDCKYL